MVIRMIQVGWRSWRDASGLVYDRKVAVKLKEKIKKKKWMMYDTAVAERRMLQ